MEPKAEQFVKPTYKLPSAQMVIFIKVYKSFKIAALLALLIFGSVFLVRENLQNPSLRRIVFWMCLKVFDFKLFSVN